MKIVNCNSEQVLEVFFRSVLAGFAAAVICGAGFFIAWIGGIQPFTGDAGMIAFITIVLAGFVGFGILAK